MEKLRSVSGRDVCVYINGRQLLQAESAEVREISQFHKVRTCFLNNDLAHVKTKPEYKLILSNMRFQQPFENINFHDLDNFTVVLTFDNTRITLSKCFWNDFRLTADKEKFREFITLTALDMEVKNISHERN